MALIEVVNEEISHVVCQHRKIKYRDSAEQRSAQCFYEAICGFFRDQHIDYMGIKQRAPKGQFAGGPVTFKMEGLIQLNPHAAIQLFAGPTIAAVLRRHDFTVPDQLKQYQAGLIVRLVVRRWRSIEHGALKNKPKKNATF